ncbi:MAG: hypothetical protein WAN11_12005, partial [Syntrophobacteraceae bacterium]
DSGPVWLAGPSPYGSFIHYSLPALTGAFSLITVHCEAVAVLHDLSECAKLLVNLFFEPIYRRDAKE